MGSDWKVTTVADLIDSGHASLQTGPFGTALKAAEYANEGVPLISVREIRHGYLKLTKHTPLINKRTSERLPRFILRQGDIIFGRKGAVERSAMVQKSQDGWFLGSDGIRLRLDGYCDHRFISYQVRSPAIQNWLMQHAEGSTMLSMNQKVLGRIPLTLPPLPEQKAIAHILGSLDDKIQLNRRMNATLEGMAQALFKSWFVDFDPVLDNALAAGNPIPDELRKKAEHRKRYAEKNNSSHNTHHSAFPSTFQFTEKLGWIPEGWRVKELGAITTQLRRGISPKYTENNGVRVINQRCIRDHSIVFSTARLNDTTKKRIDGRLLQPGDLLINSTGVGTLGRMAQVLNLDEPTVTDSHVTVVRSDQAYYKPNTFGRMMLSVEPQVEAMGHGSTGQTELSRADLSALPVIAPPLLIQEHSETLLSEWAIKIEKNNLQNTLLTRFRDTLLPTLISGELRIPDTKILAEEVIS